MKNVRCYDNGLTVDCYTAVYLDQQDLRGRGGIVYDCRAMSSRPFHPQGFGLMSTCVLGGCLYGALGRSANFGGCGETLSPELHHVWVPLKNGKSLQFFVNEDTGLVVLDVVNKRGNGGCEYVRRVIEEIKPGKQ